MQKNKKFERKTDELKPTLISVEIKTITFFMHYNAGKYDIPLTNRVRGPYRKLWTEFFPPGFMAQVRSVRAINRRGKNEDL